MILNNFIIIKLLLNTERNTYIELFLVYFEKLAQYSWQVVGILWEGASEAVGSCSSYNLLMVDDVIDHEHTEVRVKV